MSQELAPLSLAFIVDLSKSGERDASMASLLKFAAVVLSDCCCRFRSSTVCSPTGMKVPCVRIAATCGVLLILKQHIPVGLQLSGLVYPEPLVLAVG